MGLIRTILNITAAGYGVNILEVAPPTQVEGVGTNIVAVVAEMPWGPSQEITQVSGPGLFDTFSPFAFGVEATVPALKGFSNKTFPSVVKVVRVAATGALPADLTFQASAVDSVDVDARYDGAVGNSITVEWAANAVTPANRDAIVRVGTDYEVQYSNVVVLGTPITVNDPGDPYVTFTISAGAPAVVPDAITATNLTGGADGAAVAGDYTNAINALSDAGQEWSVAFVSEPPEALIAGINTAIKAFVDTFNRGFWVYNTPVGESVATVSADVINFRSDRTLRCWPKVNAVNQFDPNRALEVVDGNSFAAIAIASVAPEVSPGGAGGTVYLKGISSLVSGASDAEYESMNDLGIAPFMTSRRLQGTIIRRAVTTSVLTVDQRKVFRRRMVDFIAQSIAETLALYTERPLDLDLPTQTLGTITGPEIATIRTFMTDLKGVVGVSQRIVNFSLDPFGQNLQSNIDAGQWIIDLRVDLLSMQEEIILQLQAGTTVIINEAA